MTDVSEDSIFFYGPVEWERFEDDPLDWVERVYVASGPLGPVPPGKSFERLSDIDAAWSEDMAPWLALPSLEHLSVTKPTERLLEALNDRRLTFLRLERPRFHGPVKWPRLPRLDDLWLYSWKLVDLKGADYPTLEHLRIDSARVVANVQAANLGQKLKWVTLENVGQLSVPEGLWALPTERLTTVGKPARSPWVLEAYRLLDLVPSVQAQDHRLPPGMEKPLAAMSHSKYAHLDQAPGQDPDAAWSVTFDCGGLPGEEALDGLGHASTGHFWASLVEHRYPVLAEHITLDPEQDLFAAYGPEGHIRALRDLLEFLFKDPARLEKVLKAMASSGITLAG